ncbi:hypothetical protein [Kineosporia mesophila]|nr:hypothetical protein [Kineosporia mesophila]MCD5354639.1 hypothetical protein [Kineosporia mesophila]
MERYPVSLAGVDLEVEKPSSKHPKFLRDGAVMPQDVWGNWVLVDAQGKKHHPTIGYSQWHRSPTVRLDEREEPVVLWPLPRAARIALMAAWIVGAVTGRLPGLLCVMAGTYVSLRIYRQPDRKASHRWMIAGVWVAVVVLYVIVALIIHSVLT